MRTFKTKTFGRWALKEGLTDTVLLEAIGEIIQGLVNADLGGNVYKKRIKLPGRGKRGGARTLLAYRAKDKAFFIYGYAKNEKENIDTNDLNAVKQVANELLTQTEQQLERSVENGAVIEIKKDKEK